MPPAGKLKDLILCVGSLGGLTDLGDRTQSTNRVKEQYIWERKDLTGNVCGDPKDHRPIHVSSQKRTVEHKIY